MVKSISNPPSDSLLFGVGMDNNDDSQRITKGENFVLVGGSENTHEKMVETAVKINEALSAKHKHLSELEADEFKEIIQKINDRM